MSSPAVTCPSCGRPLKIRDPKLFGRLGKCPGCQHRFVLSVPAKSQSEPPVEQPQSVTDMNESPPPSYLDVGGPSSSILTPARHSRRRRGTKLPAIVGGLLALGIVAVFITLRVRQAAETSPKVASRVSNASTVHSESASGEADVQGAHAPMAMPRKPISLLYVPAGARIMINLHPARLFHDGRRGEELRKCLGPLADFAEHAIRDICRFQPAEIDEALFCLLLGPSGTPPELAAVIHLVKEHSKTELQQKFPGRAIVKGEDTLIAGDVHACFIKDGRTLAIAPVKLIDELVDPNGDPGVTDPGIEAVLSRTDRARDFTIVFRPDDVRLHEQRLFDEDLRPMSAFVLDWLGEGVEAAAWSVDVADSFTAQLLLRNKPAVADRLFKTTMLEKRIRERIASLPGTVLAQVEKMSPQTAGRRQLIGRLPAMIKAASLATTSSSDELLSSSERIITFSTELPQRAAPNLALATRLAWMEIGRGRSTAQKSHRPLSQSDPKMDPTGR